MDRLAGGRSQRPGGAAGAHSAHKAWAGTFGPRPCFGFAGPLGPQNAAAPRRDPTSPSSPSPARLRQPYGGRSWEAGRLRRTCGGTAAFLGPGPLAPALKTSPRPGKARQRAGGRSPPAAAPPPLRFPPTPKRQRKSQAPRSMGPGTRNAVRKGRGNGSAPLGKAAAHALRAAAASSAPPRATVSRQLRPAVARRPPPA